MKKLFTVLALSTALVSTASAQSNLGNLLGGLLGGKSSNKTEQKTEKSSESAAADAVTTAVGNVLGSVLSGTASGATTGNATVDAALGSVLGGLIGNVVTPRLNGNYEYTGVAVSMTQNEGDVVSSLAGTAASSAVETKVNEYLTKWGIKPGAMSITFDDSDKTFVWTIGGFPFNGTWQMGEDQKTISLTFGRTMQYFNMVGNLELTLDGVKMLFTSDKTTAFLKKALAKLGEKKTDIGTIAKLAAGYDNYKIGFKLAKTQQ
ncbi:MAG: DUF4923 family protein [Bacteroidales bacterium]|nr:DUF4923 family protein [Bacteroidales bacterium]